MRISTPSAPEKHPNRLKRIALIIGIAIMVWLPFEDGTAAWAVIFAAVIAAWSAVALTARFFPQPEQKRGGTILFFCTLAGMLAGLAISPLSLFLMALKSGIHQHPVPDYTPTQLLAVIRLTPVWFLSGLLTGSGSGLWRIASAKE